MLSVVLTNRNRNIRIIKNCLDSFANQSDALFEWFLVDYGSDVVYLEELIILVQNYPQLTFISCPTSGQLWSKCRAINIALKKATQPFFVVGDIDLLFHPNYISTLKNVANFQKVHYFQYGFLSQAESLKNQRFEQFEIDFIGNSEVTGNTLFPTEALKQINGFDECYQGWGAEDTDAHIRMKHAGFQLEFYDADIMVKHQWHPKTYRSQNSSNPFHSKLERINHAYMVQTQAAKTTEVNQNTEWGKMTNADDYKKLEQPTISIHLLNATLQCSALFGQLKNYNNQVVKITIDEVGKNVRYKNRMKRFLGKKYESFYTMEFLNNLLLEEIIRNYRNCPYRYSFDRNANKIVVHINFTL